MWTVNPDESDLQCQIPFGYKISHFAWRDDKRMLMSTDILGQMQFVEFTVSDLSMAVSVMETNQWTQCLDL